jgi:Putative adhesin
MQSQENIHNAPEQVAANQRNINTDPREQFQEQNYSYRSYTEGYTGLDARDAWSYGEKLRPESKDQRSIGGLLAIIVLLCAVFIAGSMFGAILSWLTWMLVVVLVVLGLAALASNWRVVTIPLPTRTFQITEHARLVLNNSSGRVVIRRGEQGVITVNATKRASGIGINPEQMQVRTEQQGDTVDISTQVDWNFFQFGLRSVSFEITVPANCDVQLNTGSGRVAIQGPSGDIRVRTGSGGIEASDLQGQIALKTGSGGIRAYNLQGSTLIQTGSGGIKLDRLQGSASVRTGSGGIVIESSALLRASNFTTGSGGIVFDGSIDRRSNVEMKTGSGGINLRLPFDSAFTLDARTGSGGVHNEFGGKEVGDAPRALLKLKTGSGGIRVHS